MAVSNGNEKRKHPRVGFTTQIKIELEADGKKILLEGNTRDLSLKGVFLNADIDVLPVGTACNLNVYLSGGIDEIVLNIKGSVARSTDAGMGISFDSMDVDTYSHLKNIVYYNSVDDPE
ncbi:MAG: PilZ domain-containing protein [Proteobacteria bacterium]|nr:PilZ domain-containing protein [Pseudomonadota bacterium]MBU1388973.1 PilZ domain-containing protein [Pseudomonadota bacterium]MBU1543525.1 PilZ domain-containing protein [Pseudomonadota bacterium]MBU2480816.1 PilZ domain-containing protein [Pseudomonadota bacterium]